MPDAEPTHATQGGKPPRKIYLSEDVLSAAHRRVRWLFDTFTDVSVSISGGKDSSVLFELAYQEARRRQRDLRVLFLDQEAEYASTIRTVERIMNLPGVVPHWYQVPILMTNATSYEAPFLHAWDPAAEADWIHPRHPLAITATAGAPNRFYPFLTWWERQRGPGAALLVGLRSEESLNRYASVTRFPGHSDVNWTSKGEGGSVKAYPLYDWAFEDIWTYLGKFEMPYNRVYDYMYARGFSINEIRVSNLIHERAFKSLATLQEFEPATYERLIRRVPGIRTAALYAREQQVYAARKLPKAFETWLAYRDFLLETLDPALTPAFRERFAGQLASEPVHRQQVRQLLLNDQENSLPVIQLPEREDPRAKWRDLL